MKGGHVTLGKSGVHFFMGEEKEEKEGERERGEKWKTEGKSVHMSRELESYRTYMSLEPKLDLDPWELVQAEGTASMTLWNNGGTGQWEGKKNQAQVCFLQRSCSNHQWPKGSIQLPLLT